jgi:exosortase
MKERSLSRNVLFALICTLFLAFYGLALKNLVALALNVDEYSHTILIPFIILGLIILERRRIFAKVSYSPRLGAAIIVGAALIGALFGSSVPGAGQDSAFRLEIISLVLGWIGAFLLSYGQLASRAAAFPLAFLFLTVPPPASLINKVIFAVQNGSAEIASFAFMLSGVPVLRDGDFFRLPHVTIEVARECSGIHSTMTLVILGVLAGYLCLRSNLKRTALVLSAIPIVCLTNGLRIAVLTLLAEYVNVSFLSGSLHRRGGIFFFLLGLGLLMICLQLLSKVGSPTRASDGEGK